MEDDTFNNLRLPEVKKSLCQAVIDCRSRGLYHTAKYLTELSHGLQSVEFADKKDLNWIPDVSDDEMELYMLAKSYYDTKEYDRAAFFVQDCVSPCPRFLHLYSTYMGKEKRRIDTLTDASNLNNSGHQQELTELLATLKADYNKGKLDGYGIYLYGVVMKAMDLSHAAIGKFVEAVQHVPLLWAAYMELSPMILSKETLYGLNIPDHWMKKLFMAHACVELYLNDEALKFYEDLKQMGFSKCVYINAQIAMIHHNKREVDTSIELFQAIQEIDPYRLENLDSYSNLLFVKELKTEMASLAHRAVEINKFSPETCCIIGNYYSIRCDHQKAILYFQRALKLNPKYLSAWTLMGHEFMELKNTNAAIQSYRKAIEVNKRDYRAWYGLGQAYEILKMHFYSLYYFKIAHQLRPCDSRMAVALGETLEKLEKYSNAIKCFENACNVGDIEGIALYRLAYLYDKLGDTENAVQSYLAYCQDDRAEKQNLYHSYMALANYYFGKNEYEEASHFAYKCLDSDEKKQEAKSLLKSIENKKYGNNAEDSLQENDMMIELEDIPEEVAALHNENNDTVGSVDLELTTPNEDVVEESQSADGNQDFLDMDISMD